MTVSDHDSAQADTCYAPRGRRIFRATISIEDFPHDQTAGGLFLLLCSVAALVLEHGTRHGCNDGPMALLIFVVGPPIMREVHALPGSASNPAASRFET